MTTAQKWFFGIVAASIPAASQPALIWCPKHVHMPGSALSDEYNLEITPWNKDPLSCADGHVRKMTYVAPIQSGKSAVGEAAICKWISKENGGDIFYYWQNDEKAHERWKTRFEKILTSCPDVLQRITDRGRDGIPELRRTGKWTLGYVQFPHCNFVMLGVNTNRNVASESVRFEVNEEIHDRESGWEPGKLEQAYGRTTAYRNHVIFNISNAGYDGDQLHTAFESGTKQFWQVKCPGCGQFHALRTRWENDRPDLGGLRYDSEGCRLDTGEINYSKLLPTVRYQMPCGKEVRDSVQERRSLSLGGCYSEPTNPGAMLTERSYTLEAVSVDYIPWIELIKQKHLALNALRNGNSKPWFDYLRERECQFVKPDDRPVVNRIILSGSKKDRAGLPNRLMRAGSLDRQQGAMAKGELPHWWGLIQDIGVDKIIADETLAKQISVPAGSEVNIIHVLTVWEGKVTTDEGAAEVMRRHDVPPSCVLADSGDDTVHVYQFCLQHGFSALKGDDEQWFPHPDGSKKIYTNDERALASMVNQPLRYRMIRAGGKPMLDPREPRFMQYSKPGLLGRMSWLRTSPVVNYEVPSDVSTDFIKHMDAWSYEQLPVKKRTKESIHGWVKHKERDDLLMCAGYCALNFEIAGYIGASTKTI